MVEKTNPASWWPDLYQPFFRMGQKIADWFSPASEAKTAGSAYEITLELPGVAEDDIEVSLHEGMLEIKGEKRSEKSEEGDGYFFSERQYGQFQRTFRLPADADAEKINAEYTDGVLKISVPKKTEKANGAKKIAVNAAKL